MDETPLAPVAYAPIGVVRSPHIRLEGMPLQSVAAQDVRGRIELLPRYERALRDLEGFSHIWVIAHLDRSEPYADPVVVPFLDDVGRGVLATRSPRHPNPIGISVVRLLSIDRPTLQVAGLDLLDGTPVLDVKPYVPYFDCTDADRTGWLEAKAQEVHAVRADARFGGIVLSATEEELIDSLTTLQPREPHGAVDPPRPSVADVMYADPKTLAHNASVGDVRELFRNSRVRVALLVHHGICTGVLARHDIPETCHDDDAAGWIARTPAAIHVDASLAEAHRAPAGNADGRLVVVDERDRLVGLL